MIQLLGAWTQLEAAETQWSIVDSDCRMDTVDHHRLGDYDEVSLVAGQGTRIHIGRRIPPAPLIDELQVRLSLRADRRGCQLFVRVVLPRTPDPDQPELPRTLLIEGDVYHRVSAWSSIAVDGIVDKLANHVRHAQLDSRQAIDAREAYVDMVVVNAYTSAGPIALQLGDPTVTGAAELASSTAAGVVAANVSMEHQEGIIAAPRIGASSDCLTLDGSPVLPRVVDDYGEPWEFLRDLGFNTIRLHKTATLKQIRRAEELGLWLVCPPPSALQVDQLATHFRRVLAWDLSTAPTARLPLIPTTELQRVGDDYRLPTLSVNDDQRRATSLRLYQRPVLATSCDFYAYVEWLAKRIQSYPGVIPWVGIETQPTPSLRKQLQVFGCQAHDGIDTTSLRTQVLLAASVGARGFVFPSQRPLDEPDAAPLAASLHRLNLELALWEPWLAASTVRWQWVESNQSPIGVLSEFRKPGASLFLRTFVSPTDHLCTAPVASDQLAHKPIFSGMRSDAKIFHCSSTGLRPVAHRRVTGGLRIEDANQPLPIAAFLAADDPSIVRRVAEEINERSKEFEKANQHALTLELESLRAVLGREQTAELQTSWEDLAAQRQSDQRHRYQQSSIELERKLIAVRHAHWHAQQRFGDHVSIPTAMLPLAGRKQMRDQLIAPITQGVNLLRSGTCEELGSMVRDGWHLHFETGAESSRAEIDTEIVRSGRGALRITTHEAARRDGDRPVATVPSFPLSSGRPTAWVTAPPTTLAAKQIVRIDGWVRIASDQDPKLALHVFDSLGGPTQGITLKAHAQWQPFTLFRGTADEVAVTITMAVRGQGVVHVDDVTISPVVLLRGANGRLARNSR